MPKSWIQGIPLLPLTPNIEIILQLNHTIIEQVHKVYLEGVWDDPTSVPPFLPGAVQDIVDQQIEQLLAKSDANQMKGIKV